MSDNDDPPPQTSTKASGGFRPPSGQVPHVKSPNKQRASHAASSNKDILVYIPDIPTNFTVTDLEQLIQTRVETTQRMKLSYIECYLKLGVAVIRLMNEEDKTHLVSTVQSMVLDLQHSINISFVDELDLDSYIVLDRKMSKIPSANEVSRRFMQTYKTRELCVCEQISVQFPNIFHISLSTFDELVKVANAPYFTIDNIVAAVYVRADYSFFEDLPPNTNDDKLSLAIATQIGERELPATSFYVQHNKQTGNAIVLSTNSAKKWLMESFLTIGGRNVSKKTKLAYRVLVSPIPRDFDINRILSHKLFAYRVVKPTHINDHLILELDDMEHYKDCLDFGALGIDNHLMKITQHTVVSNPDTSEINAENWYETNMLQIKPDIMTIISNPQHPILRYKWNAENWLQQMKKVEVIDRRSKKYDLDRHLLRVTVMLNTIGVIQRKKYVVDGEEVILKSERMRTIGYDHKAKLSHGKKLAQTEMKTPYPSTIVKVVNEDCLVLYDKLVNEGHRPLLLNMANATSPGGGYRKGDGAQEENLFRRSNYYESLDLEIADKDRSERLYCTPKCELKRPTGYAGLYPMEEFGAIYTYGITVFRQTEANGYAYMKKPLYNVCAIAMAAHRDPELTNNNMLQNKFAVNTLKKIETIFAIAHQHKHDCLVLSALGCGAFKNPPEHVALLFKSVIYQYAGFFKNIYFAIVDDHNTGNHINPNGNFLPFKDKLHDLIVHPPKIIRVNGASGPNRILDKSSDGQVTLSDVCISYLPPCQHGTKCHDLKNPQHNSTYSHPPICLQQDVTSFCDQMNDEVHMFTFIHIIKCKHGGECNSTDSTHLSEYDHPEFCKDESRCIDVDPEHLSAYRHLPICPDELICLKYLKNEQDHCNSFRHCKSVCPYDNCCIKFQDKEHIKNTIHSFRQPCPFTPYNCPKFVDYMQAGGGKKISVDVENHCLTFAHVCPYGGQCKTKEPSHFETSIHIARENCPDLDKCTKLTQEDHLESYSHPGIRDIRLFCKDPGYKCPQRFDGQHLRRYRHGKNHNHLSVAPSSGQNTSISFFHNQGQIIRTVNNYVDTSKWKKAKMPQEILNWIRALQPVHRCGKLVFESILVHGHVMSRHYMDLLKRPKYVASAVQQHSRVRLIFLQHNIPEVKHNVNELIKILVQAEFAKTGADGAPPLDVDHDYNVNMIEKKLKPPLQPRDIETIRKWAVRIAQASIELHTNPMGIGFEVDQKLGTDKQVFSILGPHLGYYYGDIVITFKQEIMFHPDANFSTQAGTSFHSGRIYKYRPWLIDPGTDDKRVEHFHNSKLHFSVPRYEYAAATELVAFTGKGNKSMNVNLDDVIQQWVAVDSHDVFEAHLPQLIPLDYIDNVYIPENLFESLTPDAQQSAKAVFKDSLIITNHQIDLSLIKPGTTVGLDVTRKPYLNFIVDGIKQKIKERINTPDISRGIVITVPGTKFEDHIVLPMTISESYDLYCLNKAKASADLEFTYIYWQAMNGDMMLTISNEKIEPGGKDQPNLRCLICYAAEKPSAAMEDYHEAYSYLNVGRPYQHYTNVHSSHFKAKSNVFYRGCNTDDFFTFCLKISHKTGDVTLSHAGPNGIYNHEKINYQFNKSDLDLAKIDYIHVSAGNQDVPIRNLTINHEPVLELHPSHDKNFKIDTSVLLGKRRASVDHIVRVPYRDDAHKISVTPKPDRPRQSERSHQPDQPYKPRSSSVQLESKEKKPSVFKRLKAVFFGPSGKDNPLTYKSSKADSRTPDPLRADSRAPGPLKADSRIPHPLKADSRTPYASTADSRAPYASTADSRTPRPLKADSRVPHPLRADSLTSYPSTTDSSTSNPKRSYSTALSTSPMTSSKLPPCQDSVYCLNQNSKDHIEKYSHPCRFNELCKRKADEPHLVHDRHNVSKCSEDRDCLELTNPVHRAEYRHTNLPDYLFPCRHLDGCYITSDEHRIKYFHGEELPSIKKSKTSTGVHSTRTARARLIPCRYGDQCRSMKNQQHLSEYSHPTS